MTAADLLDALWRDHVALAPHAARVHQLLGALGARLAHDHVALLTFDRALAGDALARPFAAAGWARHVDHGFTVDHVRVACWRHPDPALPALLVGELCVGALSPAAQAIVHGLVAQLPRELAARPDAAWAGRPWQVSHADYLALAAESPHAAWLAAFGLRAHHFTVAFDSLASFPDLDALAAFLAEHGFRIDDHGAGHAGRIQGSRAQALEQIATRHELARVAFSDTTARVPGCRYELARRYALPTGERFSGFLPLFGSAPAAARAAERGKSSALSIAL
ncbi:MAG TPA: DUF1338 domain-containing protein [Kofleriaceae bacterium]|nr:DUF1338 domain-containing protein [Kofleriaceae bacterium]